MTGAKIWKKGGLTRDNIEAKRGEMAPWSANWAGDAIKDEVYCLQRGKSLLQYVVLEKSERLTPLQLNAPTTDRLTGKARARSRHVSHA